jgi:hypothetical protein
MYIGTVVARIGGVNRVEPFAQLGYRETKKIYAEHMSDNAVEVNKIAVDLQVSYCYLSGGKWGDRLHCQEESELAGLLDWSRRPSRGRRRNSIHVSIPAIRPAGGGTALP